MVSREWDSVQVVTKGAVGVVADFALKVAPRKAEDVSPAGARIEKAGLDLGLAFQGADDILDVTASSTQLGKTVGKDEAAGKATWVRVEGLEAAQRRTTRLGRAGLRELEVALPAGEARDRLLALTAMMWNRDR